MSPDDFDNLIPCWTEPAAVLVIEDVEGERWTVGYAWLNQEGWDNTPWIDAWEGERLDLEITSSGQAAGFAVYESEHLVYAMEAGRDGSSKIDAQIDGLSVAVDGEVGSIQPPCGERTALAVQWRTAVDRLTLFPDEDGGFRMGSERYTACNITSYQVDSDGDCEDSPDSDVSWVVFDRPPTSLD